jgi:hypothetical protein
MRFPRRFVQRALTLALALTTTPALWAGQPKPAILVDTWGGSLDYGCVQALQERGFVLDAVAHHELTWERLKQFNVLVLMDFPQAGKVTKNWGGGPARGPNLEETLALLDRFLKAGGGVLVDLVQHANDVDFCNSAQKALGRWGARRPLEALSVPESFLVEHPRLHIRLFHTDRVASSPVSEGIKGVWFPVGGPWTYWSGPIDVDDGWTVVLRAPQGSRTEVIDIGKPQPGLPWYEQPFQRPGGVAEPPLFAIRDVKPGRLALFHCSPIFHLSSGTSWMHDRAMLDKGLGGKPSGFGRLLENTFRWLAQPSLESGSLGGATVAADRFVPPLLRANAREAYDGYWPRGPEVLNPHEPPPATKLCCGLIGPRTAYSGGKGNVADYAAVARQKGLSFLIFLEDFRELTREKLAALVADCKAQSADDLALFAGYRIKSNIGNTLFFFGNDPLYVLDAHLTGPDRKTFKLQGEDKDGKFVAGNSIDFIFQSLRDDINSVGYYDFTGPAKQGAMQLPHLRLFSMAGVVFYDHGKFVEDVTDQYLATNQGTMTATPVSVNLVDSPQEMAAEVDSGHALTYATAHSVKQLWPTALRWNHQYMGLNVFPSTGPLIHSWPGTYRTGAFAGESFVVWRNLLAPWLRVSAEAGLKEVALYDGTRLYRRFLPGGAKELNVRLYLSGALQQGASIVATDTKGGKAVSFPLRGWNDGSPAPVFCGDHVNDGTMHLFRGPGWCRAETIPVVPNAGETWDGGPQPSAPLFPLGIVYPAVASDLGRQDGNHYQVPYLDFCDEKASQVRSVCESQMLPGVPHNNPWSGYGPIEPTPLFDAVATFTQWTQYYTGTPTAWGAHGIPGGPVSTLYTHVLKFKRDQTVSRLEVASLWRRKLNAHVLLLVGEGDRVLHACDATPLESPGRAVYPIPTGGWWAAVSPQEANAQLHVNHGAPLTLTLSDDGRSSRMELLATLPAGGLIVKKGDEHRVAIFSMAWPMELRLPDSDALLRWVRYLQQPDGMEVVRGSRVAAPIGIVELQAQDGAIELKVPRPADRLDASLPVRVSGLNPRWTALLFQRQGYNGACRYGPPTNRVRPLGLDPSTSLRASPDGRACFPVYAGQAELTHLLVGHPVVADPNGRDLFIQVTCLKDAEGQAAPRWHVSVNNPTNQAIRSTVRKAMDLPGLKLTDATLTLQPGEYKVLLHDSPAP